MFIYQWTKVMEKIPQSLSKLLIDYCVWKQLLNCIIQISLKCVDLPNNIQILQNWALPSCRCRWIDGHLPLHDRCIWSEVQRRVQPARSGLDGQQSMSGHRLLGHAVHWGVCPAPDLPHSGEIYLHRLSFPVFDTWMATNCNHPSWDMGVWFYCCLPASCLQRPVSKLLRDQWCLLSAALRATRDAVGSCLFHCDFPR